MKKKALSVLLVAAMSASLMACGSSEEAAAPAAEAAATEEAAPAAEAATEEAAPAAEAAGGHKLTAWAWDAAFNIPALQAAADDYKANVDPEFELEIVEQSQSSDVENAITLGGSTGDYSALPDIFLFQDHYFQRYKTDYPDAFVSANDAAVDWNDFGAEKLSFSTFDGEHYGFPVDNGTVIMAYRTDLLEEAGYSIDDMTNCTWDKFMEVGKAVKEKTGKYLLSMDGSGNDLMYMMLQAEGQSQFKDGVPNLAGNDTYTQICQIVTDLTKEGVLYLANDWSDYTDQTIVGDMVAGVMNGNWIIPTMTKVEANSGKWAITNMPTIKGVGGYASNGGSSLYISGNCQDTALAKAFLAYTFGGSKVTYDAALKNGGVITTCISAGTSDVYNEGVDFFNGQAVYADIVEMGSHVPVVEQSDYHYSVRNYVGAAIINAVNGADLATEIQGAEDQLKFEMGL